MRIQVDVSRTLQISVCLLFKGIVRSFVIYLIAFMLFGFALFLYFSIFFTV